jgi:RNA polymerase sigma-70 factor, ECF subfamily
MDEPIEAVLQRAYRYAYALTGDPHRAEDLVQDGWSSVLEARGPRTAPYLFATIRNRFIDLQRRARRVQFEALEAEDVADSAIGPTGEGPEVMAAILRLRPAEREVLFLCAVEGWTAAEVAERTGRPRGTVLSLIHRGRARLRALLAGAETPQGEVAR